MRMQELEEIFGPPIHVYTRAEAIADGVLVDVSEWAREKGINAPTVFSQHLWNVVDVDGKRNRGCQSTRCRADDVLFMALLCLGRANRAGKLVDGPHPFDLLLSHGRKKKATLYVEVDGDGVTIMFPEDR